MNFDEERGLSYLSKLRKQGVEVRSIVVRQSGKLVFGHATKPFALDHVHPLYSVTKSFTSVAVGMLVEKGLICLDKPWISWFPEYEHEVLDNSFFNVTIKDLLTMTMGQDREPYVSGDDDWVLGVISKELSYKPGSVFVYNSMCSHLLSMLVQRVSGQKLADFLAERLFRPLEIKCWWWEEDRHGHSIGGFGLHLSTVDLARFGQCLLDGGIWKGKEVIPAAWVAAATQTQMQTQSFYPAEATEDRNGYGYQFWMCAKGGFRCSGLFGQLCYMRPEDDLVVAISSSTTGSKALLDPLYEVLREDVPVNSSLSRHRLATLVPVAGSPHANISEKRLIGPRQLLDNVGGFKAFELTFYDNAAGTCARFVLERAGGRLQIDAKNGSWLKSAEGSESLDKLFPFATHAAEFDVAPSWDERDVFASYGWTSSSTIEFSVRELDATRRTFIRISVDGLYAVCEIWAEGMLGVIEPMRYVMAARLKE